MEIKGTMISSSAVQITAYDKGDIRLKLQLARTTEDKEVQEAILKEGIPRVLVALASNPNLDEAVAEELAGSKLPGVAASLLNRRINE